MERCTSCGHALEVGRFCMTCGHPVGARSQVPSEPTHAAPSHSAHRQAHGPGRWVPWVAGFGTLTLVARLVGSPA